MTANSHANITKAQGEWARSESQARPKVEKTMVVAAPAIRASCSAACLARGAVLAGAGAGARGPAADFRCDRERSLCAMARLRHGKGPRSAVCMIASLRSLCSSFRRETHSYLNSVRLRVAIVTDYQQGSHFPDRCRHSRV